jgi:hypothetical protein
LGDLKRLKFNKTPLNCEGTIGNGTNTKTSAKPLKVPPVPIKHPFNRLANRENQNKHPVVSG